MKEEKRTITSSRDQVFYIAVDGTEFEERSLCESYEKSVQCLILAKLKNIEINRDMENDLFDCGSDEVECRTVVPETEKDLDNINLLYKMYGGKNNDYLYVDANDLGKPIMICIRFCSNDIDWLWMQKLESIVGACTNDKYVLKKVEQ